MEQGALNFIPTQQVHLPPVSPSWYREVVVLGKDEPVGSRTRNPLSVVQGQRVTQITDHTQASSQEGEVSEKPTEGGIYRSSKEKPTWLCLSAWLEQRDGDLQSPGPPRYLPSQERQTDIQMGVNV